MKGWVVVAMMLVVAAALSACRRSLEGARCPCVGGWTCCETTGMCLPAGDAPLACPGSAGGAGGGPGEASDGDASDGDASDGDASGARDARDPDGGDASSPDAADANGGDGPASDGPADGSADGSDGSPDGPAPLPPPDVPQVCTADGWCWTHPLPTNDRFVQVLGVGDEDVWLVGASGTIVRHAAGRWSTIPSPADALSAIWANGRDDVWVGGPSGPYHWNGSAWSQTGLGTSPGRRAVRALWGCARDDVWAAGGVITRWDGESWRFVDLPTDQPWQALWGTRCDDVWAGQLDPRTGAGATWRFDGAAWKKLDDRPAERIAGTGPEDVWSFAQGALYHRAGLDAATPGLMAPMGDGDGDGARALGLFSLATDGVGVMEVGRGVSLRTPGGTTSLPQAAPDAVATLWGKSANDIWGVGAGGTAWRWDGQTWTRVLPAWSLASDAATRIIATSATELWAIVGGALLRGDGRTWTPVLSGAETGGGVNDVWASGPDDVWVATASGHLLHSDPSGWHPEDPWPGAVLGEPIRRISGTGPRDVWVVRGDSSVLHWDGDWVGRDPDDDRITDVWAAAPDDAWIVGQRVAHWRGGNWQAPPRIPAAAASAAFTAVAGTGPADVWFLAGGYLLQLSADGRDLSVALNTDWQGIALARSPTGGVWAMFRDGAVASRLYHSLDLSTVVLAPAGLNDLAAPGDGALWVAGPGGALLRKGP
jgi:hypothetical protein